MVLTFVRLPWTLTLINTNYFLCASSLEVVALCFLLLLIYRLLPCLVWLFSNSTCSSGCCFYVTNDIKIRQLIATIPRVRNANKQQTVRFISCPIMSRPQLGRLMGGGRGGFDVTPRVWNHLKIIQSHVWCLGCDDSKARTADWSTHTRLDMWRDFLTA